MKALFGWRGDNAAGPLTWTARLGARQVPLSCSPRPALLCGSGPALRGPVSRVHKGGARALRRRGEENPALPRPQSRPRRSSRPSGRASGKDGFPGLVATGGGRKLPDSGGEVAGPSWSWEILTELLIGSGALLGVVKTCSSQSLLPAINCKDKTTCEEHSGPGLVAHLVGTIHQRFRVPFLNQPHI